MVSLQARTGWTRPRNRENKNYSSDQFPSDSYQRIRKKQQKYFKKLKKHHYGFFSSQNKQGKCRGIEKIKIIDPFNFYPTRNRKFQRIAKKFKK